MGTQNVLIIRDEAVVPEELTKSLTELGCTVLGPVKPGNGAAVKASGNKADIVLMDCSGGGAADSLATARQVEKQLKIPVIPLIPPDWELSLVQEKVDTPGGYILKPVTKRELHLVMEMALYKYDTDKARRECTEEKEQMKSQLMQAQMSQATMNLAGGIAHNFNNALVGISGNVGLLERKFREDENVTKHIKPMKASVQRMVHLTNQLLAYARGGKWRSKTISLHHFTESTLRLIKFSFGTDIALEIDFSPETVNVEVDEAQLQMVLLALLNNAKEAIPGKGKIRIIVNKTILQETVIEGNRKLPAGTYACVTITDNGKGMTREIQERIFEPFFSTRGGGRGLGMAAAYGIIRNHNGWIAVESQPGKGTTVNVYLPMADTPVMELEEPEPGEYKEIPGTGTILMVEDEDEVISVTEGIMKKLGYSVLVAKTGKEALKIVKTFTGDIDAILLDIILPDMLGTEVYHLLKEIRPGLKVIVCSGYNMDGPVQDILDAGARDFIAKPFTIHSLSEKLKKVTMEKG